MSDTTRFDAMPGDEEVERELAAYASARLTPDRFASNRMRVAVIERARLAAAAPAPHRLDVLGRFRVSLGRLAPVALVAAIAITGGTAAGVAASPGGPLYGIRVQIETALLPSSGAARTDAQIGLLDERVGEITDSIQSGNLDGTDASAEAYDDQLQQAIDSAASQRAQLLALRATLVRQLNHFETLAKPNDRMSSNVQKLIARTEAAIAAVDAKLAALGS